MKLNLDNLKEAKKLLEKCKSPKAFTAYAVIGVGVTAFLAIRAGKNSRKDILENNPEPTREEVIQEVKETAKNYIPTAVAAIVTVYCIHKAGIKWMECNELINSAYAASQARYNQLRGFSRGLAAAEALQECRKKKPPDNGKKWFLIKGMGNQLDVYFESTDYDVLYAEYHLNRNFQNRGSVSVREFFAFLDILDFYNENDGDLFGWDVGIMMEDWGLDFPWVDFRHRTYYDPDLDVEITEICYEWSPEYHSDGEPFAHWTEYDPYGSHPTD